MLIFSPVELCGGLSSSVATCLRKGRCEGDTQYLRRLADLVQFLAPKFSFLQLATIERFSIIFRHFFDAARLIKRRSTIG